MANLTTRRFGNERGAALIAALLATMLLTALGMAAVLVSNTEGMITTNYRRSTEALYAADAAIERTVQDLLMVPRWNDVLAGGTAGTAAVSNFTSSFVHGSATGSLALPAGGNVTLCCGAGSVSDQLQSETNARNVWWGSNTPTWKLYAWGPLASVLPTDTVDSDVFVAVWIADDPAETDNDPLADGNGVLTLHAEAYGGGGTRKIVEVTVNRTSTTEIERGQIAQRGQEELNQRARKAAVQMPGRALTESRMNTRTGTMNKVP